MLNDLFSGSICPFNIRETILVGQNNDHKLIINNTFYCVILRINSSLFIEEKECCSILAI